MKSGTLVDEKFEVVSTIGAGGMGCVLECRQLALDRLVALKLLPLHSPLSDEDIRRFEREALVLSRLVHENIVRFYTYGVWNDTQYIAMERLTGTSLQQRLASNNAIPVLETIDLMLQVCSGVSYAHENGVIHRDLKPSNIFLVSGIGTRKTVKLIDFGLAKLTEAQSKLTQEGVALGSLLNMSPEQCQGLDATTRSDIYSIGCILYHCLTGLPPFTADNSVALMFQHVNEPVSNAAAWHQLPAPLQAVIARCMAKDPDARYSAVKELHSELERLSLTSTVRDFVMGVRPAAAQPGKSRVSSTVLLGGIALAVLFMYVVVNMFSSRPLEASAYDTVSYWAARTDRDISAQEYGQLHRANEAYASDPEMKMSLILPALNLENKYLRYRGYELGRTSKLLADRAAELRAKGPSNEAEAKRLDAESKAAALACDEQFHKALLVSARFFSICKEPDANTLSPFMIAAVGYYEASKQAKEREIAIARIEKLLEKYPSGKFDHEPHRRLLKALLANDYMFRRTLPEAKLLLDHVHASEIDANQNTGDEVKNIDGVYEKTLAQLNASVAQLKKQYPNGDYSLTDGLKQAENYIFLGRLSEARVVLAALPQSEEGLKPGEAMWLNRARQRLADTTKRYKLLGLKV